MDAALIASATMLGLAGAPHCAAMCSAPCAAAVGRSGGRPALLSFHVARLLSYAAAGAIVASTMGALAAVSSFAPALRPLWTLVHLLALALGLWLLYTARQPAWMAAIGRVPRAAAEGPGATTPPAGTRSGPALAAAGAPVAWHGRQVPPRRSAAAGAFRSALAGAAWAAWPCGLLQSALLVAAMTAGAAAGAAAMTGFALASAPGLLLAPWLWQRLGRGGDAAARERWAVRAAGALLAAASVFALTHGLWERFAAFCAQL